MMTKRVKHIAQAADISGFNRRQILVLGAAFVLAACSAEQNAQQEPAERQGADAEPGVSFERPVVVELYQSQGCSSCPPANANLNAIAGDKDVLALSFAVTYWDRLGWKDVFAKPEFTERQWEYSRAGGRKNVATPQVIINGGEPINGGYMSELKRTIAERGAPRGGADIAFAPAADGSGTVMVGKGKSPAQPATLWLVRYDPRPQEVAISAGENTGRTLPHKNIVRELTKLGQWTGEPVKMQFGPANEQGLNSAAFMQMGEGGPIISSAKLETN